MIVEALLNYLKAKFNFSSQFGEENLKDSTMEQYIIQYGSENENYLVHADDPDHAVEQFLTAEMVSPHEDENAKSITGVYRLTEVNWYHSTQNTGPQA